MTNDLNGKKWATGKRDKGAKAVMKWEKKKTKFKVKRNLIWIIRSIHKRSNLTFSLLRKKHVMALYTPSMDLSNLRRKLHYFFTVFCKRKNQCVCDLNFAEFRFGRLFNLIASKGRSLNLNTAQFVWFWAFLIQLNATNLMYAYYRPNGLQWNELSRIRCGHHRPIPSHLTVRESPSSSKCCYITSLIHNDCILIPFGTQSKQFYSVIRSIVKSKRTCTYIHTKSSLILCTRAQVLYIIRYILCASVDRPNERVEETVIFDRFYAKNNEYQEIYAHGAILS